MNWKDFGGSNSGLFEVISRNLSGRPDKVSKNLSKNCGCSG
jgi:hypothetical protein